MFNKKTIVTIMGIWAVFSGLAAHVLRKRAEKSTFTAEIMEPIEQRNISFYEKHIKRFFDVACASAAITVFSPLYIGVAILVRIKLGSPVLFTQARPGLIGGNGKEQIFKMYKFRSMTDEKDDDGNLLSDEIRLTNFGKKLRATSLDELPEAFNILNGTMSVIGPRPQLVRDMVFMSKEQRARHTAKPGLSGLSQVNGRNAISWEDKINWDLRYIDRVSFWKDFKILVMTVMKVFGHKESTDELDITDDYGDYLLKESKVTTNKYYDLQAYARNILEAYQRTGTKI